MKETAREQFETMYNDAFEIAKKHGNGPARETILYMSGSAKRKTMLRKWLNRYRELAEMDRELQITSNEVYELQDIALEIMENSIDNYYIF